MRRNLPVCAGIRLCKAPESAHEIRKRLYGHIKIGGSGRRILTMGALKFAMGRLDSGRVYPWSMK